MTKKRIQIYADDQTMRRVELAAEKHNLPINAYCLTAIRQQLDEDGIEVDAQNLEVEQTQFQEVINELRQLQERILHKRNGQPVDVDTLVEQLREERDEEALGLR